MPSQAAPPARGARCAAEHPHENPCKTVLQCPTVPELLKALHQRAAGFARPQVGAHALCGCVHVCVCVVLCCVCVCAVCVLCVCVSLLGGGGAARVVEGCVGVCWSQEVLQSPPSLLM